MNKIVFVTVLSLVNFVFADAPVEIGEHSVRRLAEDLAALQRFVYKRFGGDPAYQEAGANPPHDPSQTMLLEKIQDLNTRLTDLTNRGEELQHQIQTVKMATEKIQEQLEVKISHLEQQFSETKNTIKKREDLAYQEKLNKMTSDELILHIETAGKMLTEEHFEKALRLFVTKFIKDKRIASIYKELVYLMYKKEAYKEAAMYAGEFYKTSSEATETPEILLMMAFALGKLEKNKEACMTISKIKTDYPNVSEDFKERLTMASTSFSCSN
jgi:TolA-binding protein